MANIEHFAIYAEDSVALKNFYVQTFGMKVASESKGSPPSYFLIDGQGMAMELIHRPPGMEGANQRWVCHFAFWTGDYPKTHAELEALGIVFEIETAVDNDSLKTAFFNDPAGNRCQIVWRADRIGG